MLKKKSMKFKKNYIYIAILVFGVAVSIWGGAKFLKSLDTENTLRIKDSNQSFPERGERQWGQNPPNRENFKPISGIVESIKDNVIILKTDDDSIKNIICLSSTRIMKTENGKRNELALSDIKRGDEINVMSNSNDQTNIEARMIIVGKFEPFQNRDNFQDSEQI